MDLIYLHIGVPIT